MGSRVCLLLADCFPEEMGQLGWEDMQPSALRAAGERSYPAKQIVARGQGVGWEPSGAEPPYGVTALRRFSFFRRTSTVFFRAGAEADTVQPKERERNFRDSRPLMGSATDHHPTCNYTRTPIGGPFDLHT